MKFNHSCICGLLLTLASCATYEGSISEQRFQSSILSKQSIVALSLDVRQTEKRTQLFIRIKNKQGSSIAIGGFKEFDELSFSLLKKQNTDWIPIESNRPKPIPRFGSYRFQLLPRGSIYHWMVPLDLFYRLDPGIYRVSATVTFNLYPRGNSYTVCSSVGPCEFVIPPRT